VGDKRRYDPGQRFLRFRGSKNSPWIQELCL